MKFTGTFLSEIGFYIISFFFSVENTTELLNKELFLGYYVKIRAFNWLNSVTKTVLKFLHVYNRPGSLTGGGILGFESSCGRAGLSGSGSGVWSASALMINASCRRLSSSSSQIPARLSSSRCFCLPRSASENKRNIINGSFTANTSKEEENRTLIR